MHVIRLASPVPHLRPYVRWYAQRRGEIWNTIVSHPVPARAAPLLEFTFGDRFRVRYRGRAGPEFSPRSVIVGPQTEYRGELLLEGRIECFVILFQPTGLHRLFSIPVSELTDRDYEAHSVLGSIVSSLEQRLSDCKSFGEQVRITDNFLLRQAAKSCFADGICKAANHVLRTGGDVRVPALAELAGLSTRQFERRFVQEVGTSPKLYARIARFEAALDRKARCLNKSWTDVAHEFGYHDQMHMIHDFEGFTGQSPTRILDHMEALFREHIRATRCSADASLLQEDRLIL